MNPAKITSDMPLTCADRISTRRKPKVIAPAAGRERSVPERRAAIVSIAAAGLLVVLKLGVGAITGSLGLISVGVESSGDLIAATLTFFVVRLGGRPADPEHPYGHRRAQNL